MAQMCLWLSASDTAPARLEAAMAAVTLACVFIDGKAEAVARELVDLAQKRNVAAVLVDQVALAKRLRADGVHLSAGDDVLERLAAARKALGDGAIVGAACGSSRHVAMEIGECGADYVAFGPENEAVAGGSDAADDETDETGDTDETDDPEAPMTRAEMVAWWSVVFEVPCLAMDVADTDDETAYALGPGDFAAWRWASGVAIADGVAALRALQGLLAEAEAGS